MPEIQIRAATIEDLPILTALNQHYTSNYVWQMEFQQGREEGQISSGFRRVRLPRPVLVEYPRKPHFYPDTWNVDSSVIVSCIKSELIGYVQIVLNLVPLSAWITDLVVETSIRRKGIGSALILASTDWADQMDSRNLILEMQPKNDPAIQMALKLGFEFCGYNTIYYSNYETALFFRRSI